MRQATRASSARAATTASRHQGYLDECRRIVTLLAERYGRHEHVQAWQTDNEYGCHDTTLSYSHRRTRAFRDWLRAALPKH